MITSIKLWLRDESPQSIQSSYEQLREIKNYTLYGRFYAVKQICGGLLPPTVYRQIYETLQDVGDLDCIEIGGAAGAGSIAAAWGLKDGGDGSLIVVEKCEGGSRAQYGGHDDNLARIRSNFRTFDVANRIRLFPNEVTLQNGNEVLALVETNEIGALILDADGRLDRDFSLFWKRLRPGAPIIVDDYKNEPEFCPRSELRPDGGLKKVLTYRLLNQIETWGLFESVEQIGSTVFGRKPLRANFDKFDKKVTSAILRDLESERSDYLRNNNIEESV